MSSRSTKGLFLESFLIKEITATELAVQVINAFSVSPGPNRLGRIVSTLTTSPKKQDNNLRLRHCLLTQKYILHSGSSSSHFFLSPSFKGQFHASIASDKHWTMTVAKRCKIGVTAANPNFMRNKEQNIVIN